MSTTLQGQSALTFTFEPNTVRVILRDGEPWFVATDVCNALALKNPTVAVQALDEDERSKLNLGRQGEANAVNESGLYTLILRCRDATKQGTTAHRFRKWVTNEVLPAIRKTGTYTAPFTERPPMTTEQWHELSRAIQRLTGNWYMSGNDGHVAHICNHIRQAFGVSKVEYLRADQVVAAIALVNSKRESVDQMLAFLAELRDWFDREVLSGGT